MRAYSGPARPPSEVSTITFLPLGDLSVRRVLIDGQAVSGFSDTIDVLPGQHSYEIYSVIDIQDECPPGTFYCYTSRLSGVCKGTLYSLAGRSYLVIVESKHSFVSTRVVAKGYFDFAEREDENPPGAGSCQGF